MAVKVWAVGIWLACIITQPQRLLPFNVSLWIFII